MVPFDMTRYRPIEGSARDSVPELIRHTKVRRKARTHDMLVTILEAEEIIVLALEPLLPDHIGFPLPPQSGVVIHRGEYRGVLGF